MLVGDLEGDLCRPAVAHEPRDPGGPRVSLDVGNEHVVLGVHAGERSELRLAEARLRAAEAPLARA